MRHLLLLSLALLTACGSAPPEPAAAVTGPEGDAAVQRLVELASQRTPAAMGELCPEQGCHGLSGSIVHEPELAPGADRPPRQVCSVALPPNPRQTGARLVVLQGRRSDGRSYVGQVLLERVDGRVVPHEPGFWLGIRYTALQRGMAWSTGGDLPAERAEHEAAALRACSDTAEWLTQVAGT